MRRLYIILLLLAGIIGEAGAVLKEKNLEQTLTILRSELTKQYVDLNEQREERQEQREQVYQSLSQTMRQANQNALMLYSQDQEYLFDLTYACHQATELYQEFQRRQVPFREYHAHFRGFRLFCRRFSKFPRKVDVFLRFSPTCR